jgi:hypothetical protein
MSASRTTVVRTASVVALLAAAGFAGWAGAAEAAPATTSGSCGDPLDRDVEWPPELPVGTRLVSEAHTHYVVQTDCGALTLIRSDDPDSCWYMTGYGLQRYPC